MGLRWFDIFFIVIESTTAICALLGNLTIIIIFFYDETLRIKRNFFLCSLAFSNILRSLIEIPLSIVIYFGIPHDLNLCLFSLSCVLSIRMMSNYFVTTIALDRYQAVAKPFVYRTSSNIPTAFELVFCLLLSLLMGFLILMWHVDDFPGCFFYAKIDKDYYLMYSIVGVSLPCFALFVIYGMIYYKIRQLYKYDEFLSANQDESVRHGKEIKATLKITLIVGVFVICGMPINIANVIEVLGVHLTDDLVHSFLILAHLNTAIDPILYAYKLPDFQHAFRRILRRNESFDSFT